MASDAVLQALKRLSVEGFVALRRRGVEVGGLLLGGALGDEVKIDDFEEMPCEHRYGPSYILSEADRAKLEGALAQRAGTQPAVVGFFRSFTSREPAIEEADEAFVREHYPSGWFVYLMLHPISVEKYEVRARLFRDGVLLPEEGELSQPTAAEPAWVDLNEGLPAPDAPNDSLPEPGPLEPIEPESIQNLAVETVRKTDWPAESERKEFLSVESESHEIADPPVPPPPPRILPTSRITPPPQVYATERETEPGRRLRWWIPALVCLSCAAAGAWISRMAAPLATRDGHWKELRMDARPSGELVEVRWDAGSQGQSATRGHLEVTDGASHREFDLDGDQLRSGTLTYQPISGDVEFRLSVYAKSSEIAGGMVRLKAIARPEANPAIAMAATEASPPEQVSGDTKGGADRIAGPEVAAAPTEIHRVTPGIPEGIRSRMAGPVIIPVQVEVNRRGKVVRAVAENNPSADSGIPLPGRSGAEVGVRVAVPAG